MKKCPYCSAQVGDDSLFCTECGKPIPQGCVCPNCGAVLNEGDAFCTNCGKEVAEKQSTTSSEFSSASQNENVAISEYNQPIDEDAEPNPSSKKTIPVIIGIIVLALIGGGWYGFKTYKANNEVKEVKKEPYSIPIDTDTIVTTEIDKTNTNSVIADYSKSMIYPGEYVFDATLIDATETKTEKTYTVKIDGNKVSVSDGEMNMQGDIDNKLNIVVGYDPDDGLHIYSLTLNPNDKEGKEWKGEWQSNAMFYNVVMTLKECKQQESSISITEERKSDDSSEDDSSTENYE